MSDKIIQGLERLLGAFLAESGQVEMLLYQQSGQPVRASAAAIDITAIAVDEVRKRRHYQYEMARQLLDEVNESNLLKALKIASQRIVTMQIDKSGIGHLPEDIFSDCLERAVQSQ